MAVKIAINGYGRIGRQVLRAVYERNWRNQFEIMAINASGGEEITAHLTQYDTTHGRFNQPVSFKGGQLQVGQDKIPLFFTRDPKTLPWAKLGVDLVMECTGAFKTKAEASIHLQQGAKKVLISAPGGKDVDATIVYGVNDDQLRSDMTVISNASCTTNCLAPMIQPLQEKVGINKGLMTTVHAYTQDQNLLDARPRHRDLRRARGAADNLVPTKTGAAEAIGLVIPSLKRKLDGLAIRVPTPNVSLTDLSFEASRDTTKEEINAIVKEAAESSLKGILYYSTKPLVSSDFNHTSYASIFDATLTKVIGGNFVKVLACYDNEWGFSCQMLRTAAALFNIKLAEP